jgi:electron transfer flavoprotein beta subunit
MRALVAVKRAIDYSVKIRVRPDNLGVETQNVKMSMNPFCEIALEEALRLKEKGFLNEVVAVSVGSEKSQEVLRQALAMGADRGVLVSSGDMDVFPLQVARILQFLVTRENSDLVLLGKQSIDGDNHQTGQILAGILNWPMATCISKIESEISSSNFRVHREVDAGTEVVQLSLPAVLTADLRLNEPRFATLPNLMKAKKKPLEILKISDLPAEIKHTDMEVLRVEEPPKRKSGVVVKSVDELLQKLREEAKVL